MKKYTSEGDYRRQHPDRCCSGCGSVFTSSRARLDHEPCPDVDRRRSLYLRDCINGILDDWTGIAPDDPSPDEMKLRLQCAAVLRGIAKCFPRFRSKMTPEQCEELAETLFDAYDQRDRLSSNRVPTCSECGRNTKDGAGCPECRWS